MSRTSTTLIFNENSEKMHTVQCKTSVCRYVYVVNWYIYWYLLELSLNATCVRTYFQYTYIHVQHRRPDHWWRTKHPMIWSTKINQDHIKFTNVILINLCFTKSILLWMDQGKFYAEACCIFHREYVILLCLNVILRL